MHLTREQLDSIRCGQPVRVQQAGTDVVVLRADVYEHLQFSVADDSVWLDDAMYFRSPENTDLPGWESVEIAQSPDSTS